MTNADYTMALELVTGQANVMEMARDVIEEATKAADRMESIGPIFEPSAFVQQPDAFKKLRQQKELLSAGLDFINRVQRLREDK